MEDRNLDSDWLQDTLLDVAGRLCQPDVSPTDLARCATQLERIVADLRTPIEELERRPERHRHHRRPVAQPGWNARSVLTGLLAAAAGYFLVRLAFPRSRPEDKHD